MPSKPEPVTDAEIAALLEAREQWIRAVQAANSREAVGADRARADIAEREYEDVAVTLASRLVADLRAARARIRELEGDLKRIRDTAHESDYVDIDQLGSDLETCEIIAREALKR